MPGSNGIVFFSENATDPTAFFIGYEQQTKWVLHLIGSDMTMNHGTTLAQLQAAELPLAHGYAPKDMLLRNGGPNWTLTPTDKGADAAYKQLAFVFTGALTVYGYWYNNVTDAFSIMGEIFPVAFAVPAAGGTFPFQPRFSLTSQP